jgi:hypothetical protein
LLYGGALERTGGNVRSGDDGEIRERSVGLYDAGFHVDATTTREAVLT